MVDTLKKSFETLEEMWEHYQQIAVPPNAYPEQIKQTKQAFYAGSAAMFNRLFEGSEKSDEEAEKMIIALSEELKNFQIGIIGEQDGTKH